MPTTLKCPGCDSSLRLRDDLAGKKIKCPRCEEIITVPMPEEEAAEVEPVAEEAITEAPRKKQKAAVTSRRPEPEEDEDEAPRRKKKRRDDDDEGDDDRGGKRKKRWQPCPQCGCPDAKRVVWTAWGSFYGPAMFSHVRCLDCDYKYNGRTGGSNLIPAIIFVTIPLMFILGLVGFVGYMLLQYFGVF